jgi:hypothetical protein
MGALIYWTLRLIVGFLGVVLWGLSARAGVTVFGVLFFEFFGFLWMTFPGSSGMGALQLYAGVGLILGALLSIGRHRPPLWQLPALAGGLMLVLRFSLLFDAQGHDFRATLPMHLVAVLGLPAGMLAGGAAAAGLARARRKTS